MVTLTEPAPASLADIEDLYCGSVYPRLEGCETALAIFCAHWYGRQDAYWLARAGITTTCVDVNAEKLAAMRAVYPDDWEFVTADAYEWAQGTDRTWDVVTLDPWLGHFQRCADQLPLWCSLAHRVVVLGHGDYRLVEPEAPEGWHLEHKIRRSDYRGGVNWLVFKRD